MRRCPAAFAAIWVAAGVMATGQSGSASRPAAVLVLEKAQKALGGRARLDAVKTVRRRWELRRNADGQTIEQTLEVILPSVSRLTNHMGAMSMAAYSDGTNGWVSSALGFDPLPAWQVQASRQEILRQLESLVLSDQVEGRIVESMGDSVARARKVQGAKVTAGGVSVILWVDAANGDPVKLEYTRITPSGRGALPVAEYYEDFRPEGPLRVPHAIVTEESGVPFMRARLVKVEYNPPLTIGELSRKPGS